MVRSNCLHAFFAALWMSGAPVYGADFLPDTRYNPQIPDLETVLGHAAGERISSPAQIRDYFEALAEAAPDRIRLVPYAESWQGRELFYAIIGTPERLADLDRIRSDIQTIARPDRHDPGTVDQAISRVPATAWLAYSVHGNEISPADAALVTAWHLLAAQDDALVKQILGNTLVFINPLQNPDGRERFVHQFEMAEGLEPSASRLAAEHDEPWPSGRVNHYLFDLNRDWLAITQPETRGHVDALLDWYPLAFVDAHEMGSDSSFFFAPEAIPYNPLLASAQRDNLALFGQNNARWFDRFGFAYFTREIFDAFYPGYGASWPSYYGGIAMTYEQSSARGLVMRRQDGREMTYAETVREYVVASLATLETVSVHRDKLWQDFREYRQSALDLARREGPAGWVIPAQADQGGADRLGGLLARHGIDVYRSEQTINACGRELSADSLIIPAAQPEYRKLRVLLDTRIDMEEDFLAEQERRRARGLPDEIYDVTAWSLPLMFNIDTLECRRAVATDGMKPVQPDEQPPGLLSQPLASVAFLAAGQSKTTARLLAASLRAGLTVQINERAFVHDGTRYPSGTLIFPVTGNDDQLSEQLRILASETGARITGVNSSWISDGPNFGSHRVRTLYAPRIALAWDQPTDSYSPGALRFVLERQIGYPITPIRAATLARADLGRFDVVILPDDSRRWGGGYTNMLGDSGRENLAGWVRDGGTLVTLAGATEWAAHPDVDLLAFRLENLAIEASSSETEKEKSARVPGIIIETPDELEALSQATDTPPDNVSGVLVKAEVDSEHWLAAGVAERVNVLLRGNRIFQPLKRDQGDTVARYAGPDDILSSGYLWDENRQQLAYKPYVVIQTLGRGQVIGFTEDPAIRAYLDGLNQLLVNATLVAPAYSRKLR